MVLRLGEALALGPWGEGLLKVATISLQLLSEGPGCGSPRAHHK